MSDKKLLAENTIRRFMKLANVDTLTNNFVNEKYAMAHKRHEELDEEVEDTNEEINEEEELEENEELELEEELESEEEGEEMEMDMDMGAVDDAEPAMGAADMSLTEEEAKLLISLGERLTAAMGEEEAPADDDAMADMDPMGDEVGEEDPAAEDPAGRDYMMEDSQEDLVNEVLKRVTKRLVAEKLKNRK